MTHNFLAFDFGAESGRAILGHFDGDRLSLEEVHRFPNVPLRQPDGLHWNVDDLFTQIKVGLAACRRMHGEPESIGIDTWGVDFGLLDADGKLLFSPFHYRDGRTNGVMEKLFQRVPREEVYAETGVQFLPFNSLYQLYSMALADAPALNEARTLLMIPDLFNYWLTGRAACEYTNATTTQFFNPTTGAWAESLLRRLDIPTQFLPPIVQPGTALGSLLPSIVDETGIRDAQVIVPACHDTGSAVAAVPASDDDAAYISSGTWSLVGVETREPLISRESLENNFTNEGGVAGRIRFLKNVQALWLLQECRRSWERQGEALSYSEIAALAESAAPFGPIVDVDDAAFLSPPDMPQAIESYCRQSGQTPPTDKATLVRCILESIALKYRAVLGQIESMRGRSVSAIHIVGGGSRNRLLCQLTADATGKPVTAGPVEATAIGNVLVQAIALGHLRSLEEGRALVRHSFDIDCYEPRVDVHWDEAYSRLLGLR